MGNWSIELGERPLNANWLVKTFIGKDVSHSFIRIKNDENKPVFELHGLYSTGIGAAFNTAAKFLFGRPMHASHLRVLALTSPRKMRMFRAHSPVTRRVEVVGSEAEVLSDSLCMIRAAKRINFEQLDYFFNLRGGGQNCHSVSAELFRRVGIDVKSQSLGFQTPGRETSLVAGTPALGAIHPDQEKSVEDIKKAIVEEIASISPDFNPFFCRRLAGSRAAVRSSPKSQYAAALG